MTNQRYQRKMVIKGGTSRITENNGAAVLGVP